MDGFGVFLDPRTVRFERVLPAHVKRVWGYLTETELAAGWFAEAEIEPREGGEVELRIVVGQVPARELSGHVVRGTVQKVEASAGCARDYIKVGRSVARAIRESAA